MVALGTTVAWVGAERCRPLCNVEHWRPYRRPLQVSRYLRQFPAPCSPSSFLWRHACLNSAHTSLRTGRWQVSRYLRQFPSPRSPRASLFSQASRNCSHCRPPRPSYIRTPPGPNSTDCEKAAIGITKRAVAAAAPNACLRIAEISIFLIASPPVCVGYEAAWSRIHGWELRLCVHEPFGSWTKTLKRLI